MHELQLNCGALFAPNPGLGGQLGTCKPKPNDLCEGDWDCAEDEYCDFAGPFPTSEDDATDMIMLGTCLPKVTYCAGDWECEENEYCHFEDGETDGAGEADWVQLGICKPQVTSCAGDWDCAEGEYCEFDGATDDAGAAADPIVQQGTCQPKPTTPCSQDADCADDEYCAFDDSDNEKAGPALSPLPEGTCKPKPTECWDDGDCAEGEACVFDDGAASDSDWAPDPAPMPGTCQPKPPETCMVTGCSGQICAEEPVVTTCEMNPWFKCLQLTSCGMVDGACGWKPTDAYLDCLNQLCGDDEDCG